MAQVEYKGVDTVSASTTDAANKAYVDAHVSPAGTYLPLAGGTMNSGATIGMTGSLTIDGGGSSTDVLKLKGSARIQIENASATDSVYISNTGGSGASTLDLGGALSLVENGDATFTGDLIIPGYINHAGDSGTKFGFEGNDAFRLYTSSAMQLQIDSSGNATFAGDLTVSGGDIVLGGTGRIQGIDTVSSGTDAANKSYVDTQIATIPSGLNFQGNWNASTNSPTLASGTGTPGFYYNVSVAGSTNLDGETDWQVGDWAVFVEAGATDKWEKIDNTSALTGTGVAGRVAYWDSTNNLTQDSDLTFDGSNLAVGGTVSWSGGSSGESNTAFDRSITGFSDSGSSTTTLTLTRQDGVTLTTSFSNPQGTVTGTGTNNRIALWNGTTAIDSDSDFYVDGDTIFTTNLEAGGNITVTGDINSAGLTVDYTGNRTGDAGILVTNDSNDWGIKVDKDPTGDDYGILSQTDGDNAIVVRSSDGTQKITLRGNGSATFTGQVSGITPSASANFTTKAYVDNAISTGVGAYLPLAGGTMTGDLVIADNVKIEVGSGTGGDLNILHDSNHSYIKNYTGDLYIENFADDKDIIFKSDDGSGGVENYIQIDGSEGRTTFNKNIRANDNVQVQVGGSADLQIYHDGSNSHMLNLTGNLRIRNFADDSDITFESDDGSGGTATYFYLDGSGAITRVSRNFRADDNVALQVGSSGDAGFFHNGTNTYIQNDTGDLYIRSNFQDRDIILQSDDGGGGIATYIQADGSTGAVNLNHYGSTKLQTTSTGVSVTGNGIFSGNVGIGITPVEVLDLKAASGDTRIRLDAASGSDTEVKFF